MPNEFYFSLIFDNFIFFSKVNQKTHAMPMTEISISFENDYERLLTQIVLICAMQCKLTHVLALKLKQI